MVDRNRHDDLVWRQRCDAAHDAQSRIADVTVAGTKTAPVKYKQGALRADTRQLSKEIKALGELSKRLDEAFGDDKGTILVRGDTEWEAHAPADGYLKNDNGVLSWVNVASPPIWELIETRTVNGDEDFTGLAGYQSIIIELVNINISASGRVGLRVSTDNGSTFLSTSGDYYGSSGSGGKTSLTEIALNSVDGTTAIYSHHRIDCFSLAMVKPSPGAFGTNFHIATTSPLNAIRIFGTAGPLSSGTIHLAGLPGI
jgi:hypothetical protein